MKINNISCSFTTCKECKNHVLVKETIFGNKIYICQHFPKKHRAISALNCGAFKCNISYDSYTCNNCIQNKNIKVLKKRLVRR